MTNRPNSTTTSQGGQAGLTKVFEEWYKINMSQNKFEEMLNLPLTVKLSFDPQSSDAPWVAYNPEFDATSCGPTPEDARKNLREVIEIYLEYAEQQGTLEEMLGEAGFHKIKRTWHLPKISFEPFFLPLPKSLQHQKWTLA